jgi:hypothetical protein
MFDQVVFIFNADGEAQEIVPVYLEPPAVSWPEWTSTVSGRRLALLWFHRCSLSFIGGEVYNDIGTHFWRESA